jgi:rare lipoprotein A (peptidoglycan hydrolase)
VRHFWTVVALVAIFTFLLAAPASAYTGVASYYDLTGNYTASGDVLEYDDLTCASPLNPDGTPVYAFGTYLRISWGGASVTCVVTDTGGFAALGRDVDMNVGVANAVGFAQSGVGVDYVDIEVVGYDEGWYYGRQY